VNLPGEVSSVVTCLDGYQMARKGQAGKALGVAALGSFFAGSVATLLIAGFAPPLAELALKFGPADYFSLMVLGLIAAVVLAHGSVIKAIGMIVLGLADRVDRHRRELGRRALQLRPAGAHRRPGIGTIAMGMFGFSEIIRNLETGEGEREVFTKSIHGLWPTWSDIKQAFPATVRGTILGSMLGILPGGGPVLGSFSAYTLEKKLSKTPERFGKGAIEGVAAPESANNAAAQTSFIPLLTLGIPSNPTMALMIGAMIIHGIQPGPQIMTAKPELFWGMIASMWVGNFLLVVLNLPLIGMWVKLLTVKYDYLFPAILIFCCIGVYSISNAPMDVLLAALFGFIGYVFIKLDMEPAPLAARFRARADDGGEPAARAAALARRGLGLLHAPDQPHAAHHLGRAAPDRGLAQHREETRRGLSGVAGGVHSAVVARTPARSAIPARAAGSTGFTTCSSNPASRERRLSSSVPYPVKATNRTLRATARRMRRATS
jgi:TctA family transporter